DAHAPRRVAVGHDLILEFDQFVPGLWDGVARFLKGLLGVPDEALDVHAFPNADHDGVAVRTRLRRHVEPAVDVLAAKVFVAHVSADVDELAGAARLPIKPGCGKSAISGTLPASARVEIVTSNCFELSYWISMPVASSKARTFSLNLTSSASA